jgi:imidazole glycerol-phosphate synthase subunit HisH
MRPKVLIVDYGIGNLHSVARALEHAGATAALTSDAGEIANAERLVLPGVGAFEPCIRNVREGGFVDPILSFVRSGRPFLGICVGMQLLFDHSNEFGRHAGLGIIAGGVEPIPDKDEKGGLRKVPHIGWSPLLPAGGRTGWRGTLLEDAQPGVTSAYFVHSFSGVPTQERDRLADVDYQGYAICAAVQKDNVTGFQCHPEKSGPIGLQILARFIGK